MLLCIQPSQKNQPAARHLGSAWWSTAHTRSCARPHPRPQLGTRPGICPPTWAQSRPNSCWILSAVGSDPMVVCRSRRVKTCRLPSPPNPTVILSLPFPLCSGGGGPWLAGEGGGTAAGTPLACTSAGGRTRHHRAALLQCPEPGRAMRRALAARLVLFPHGGGRAPVSRCLWSMGCPVRRLPWRSVGAAGETVRSAGPYSC